MLLILTLAGGEDSDNRWCVAGGQEGPRAAARSNVVCDTSTKQGGAFVGFADPQRRAASGPGIRPKGLSLVALPAWAMMNLPLYWGAVIFRFIGRRRHRPVVPLELEGKGLIAQSCDALSGQLVRNKSTPRPAEKRYAGPETLGAGRS